MWRFVIENDTEVHELAMIAFAKTYLKERGYSVSPPNAKWEKTGEWRHRLKLNWRTSLNDLIEQWQGRGHHIPVSRGPTGRLKELLSNKAFDEFCVRFKK
jgi:hypothetical protein